MIAWNEKLSLGVPRIDADHIVLLSLLNQAHINADADDDSEYFINILDALANYTIYHFKMEENIMLSGKYNEYENHKKEHEKLRSTLSSIRYDCSVKVIDQRKIRTMLAKWLFSHICIEDRKLCEWIKCNNIQVPNIKYHILDTL